MRLSKQWILQWQEMFLKIFRNIFCVQDTKFVSAQMLRAWQNEDTFGKHDHVSNVAATMCPRFAGPLDDPYESYGSYGSTHQRRGDTQMLKNSKSHESTATGCTGRDYIRRPVRVVRVVNTLDDPYGLYGSYGSTGTRGRGTLRYWKTLSLTSRLLAYTTREYIRRLVRVVRVVTILATRTDCTGREYIRRPVRVVRVVRIDRHQRQGDTQVLKNSKSHESTASLYDSWIH